jgi:riboflavin synthase
MFTGIVDHCGTIVSIEKNAQTLRALIACDFVDLQEGESVAVDGCCLTAVEPKAKQFYCDVSPETLRLTTAEKWVVGSKLNLERALCVGDRMGGHWITGHVDQRGVVKNKFKQQEFVVLEIEGVADESKSFLLKKGSVSVSGVSLTINEVSTNGFQLMLIPHTLERTNLNQLQIGDVVNLEFDWMARVIVNHLKNIG